MHPDRQDHPVRRDQPHETPLAFARRAVARKPHQAPGIRAVTDTFLEAHYGRGDRRLAARRIRAALRRYRDSPGGGGYGTPSR